MTIEERNKKLKAYITCLKCEVRGRYCSDDCATQYEAGNMGEIIENLEAISKALEEEPKTGHWIEHEQNEIAYIECSECLTWFLRCHLTRNSFCPNCGVKMVEPEE